MAKGVESAMVICPFMTEDYESSESCELELNYAKDRKVEVRLNFHFVASTQFIFNFSLYFKVRFHKTSGMMACMFDLGGMKF